MALAKQFFHTSDSTNVSATVLRQIFDVPDFLEVDKGVFLHTLGIDPGIENFLDAHIPLDTYLVIQVEIHGIIALGLHLSIEGA